jgi:CubicO group peptidase (beta-lactamase class C family)
MNIAAIVVCTLLPAIGAQAQNLTGPGVPALVDRVFVAADKEFAKSPIGALSVAVVYDGHAEARHFGHTDGKDGPAPTGTTLYRIGSITKMFTALMLLQLEATDRCSFSDPVEKFVPEFASIPHGPPTGVKATLIQLATHTAGLGRDPEDAGALELGPVADWQGNLSAAVPKSRYRAEPGSSFAYSNIGYAFLGAALTKAAGTAYPQYITAHILQPLAMGDTVFEPTAQQLARLAPGHVIEEHGISTKEAAAELAGRGWRVPVGGLFSTLDDMTRWLRFQMGEPTPVVLPADDLAKAQRRITLSGPRLRSGYGIGVQLQRFGETVVFGHSGGVPGYQAELFFDPDQQVGVVVLRSAVFGATDTQAILAAAFAP